MNLTLKNFAAVLAVAVPLHAVAGTVICGGTVAQLAYHTGPGPGTVMLRLSNMNAPVFICSTDQDWVVPDALGYITKPGACKAMYATFLAAKVSGGTINSVYFDGAQVPAACNAWANWSQANVRYFEY